MRRRLLPSVVATLVSAATGGGFHLTPGDLTLATLAAGIFSATIVGFFQMRSNRKEDKTPDYFISRLEAAEADRESLRKQLAAKDELIDELRRHEDNDHQG